MKTLDRRIEFHEGYDVRRPGKSPAAQGVLRDTEDHP